MRLVFDVEANGLLDKADKIWCITSKDIDSGDKDQWSIKTGKNITEAIQDKVYIADELIGQNIIQYDLPLIEKVTGLDYVKKVTDTLVMSRLLNPDRSKPAGYTGKGGPHSLECYGHRLGRAKPGHEDWQNFSPEMLHRNDEDTEITHLLYNYLIAEMGDWDWSEALRIEHETARIIAQQERNGILFDKPRAVEYVQRLSSEIETIDEEIVPQLPKTLVRPYPGPLSRPFLKTGGYTKRARAYLDEAYPEAAGCIAGPFSRIRFDIFDLGSVAKIKQYLISNGWEPENWNYSKTTGERTSAKLEGDFKGVDGKIPTQVKRRITWRHRRSQIEGWLGRLREDGRISAGANPCGTNTRRMKHRDVVNVPKANANKKTRELIWDTQLQKDIFGTQMRSLFTVPVGYKLVGHDASGIQLRLLAHYMGDKEFTEQILSGDIHEYNRKLAGLSDRDAAKTFIYALVFGAGDHKIGTIVGGTSTDGAELKGNFFAALPKLEKLIKSVKRASGKGYLKSLDNGKIWMRRGDDGRIQRNKALNALLQGAEAVIMKQSAIYLDQWVSEAKLDAIKVLDMHDEAQWQVKEEDVEPYCELAVKSIVQAGEYFNLNIPLAAEAKAGNNWAETH